jgi:hypothetical protein
MQLARPTILLVSGLGEPMSRPWYLLVLQPMMEEDE